MSSARVVALLLLLHPHPIPASGVLKSWPFMLDGGPRTNNDDEPGFTAEKWGTNHVQTESTDEHRTITVRGNNRVYAVEDINVRDWAEVRYHKFPIRQAALFQRRPQRCEMRVQRVRVLGGHAGARLCRPEESRRVLRHPGL